MALIHATGKLTYRHPAADGITTVQGYSHDWPPTRRWEHSGTELLGDPVWGIAPAGDTRPVSMGSTFAIVPSYNQSLREIYLPGNPPALSYEYYDGTVYADGTAITTCAGGVRSVVTDMVPNFTLRLCRYAPPPTQGVVPQTTVALYAQVRVVSADGGYYLNRNGTWTNGVVYFLLPFQSEIYKRPALAWRASRSGGYFGTQDFFSEGPSAQSMDGGMAAEMWAFEWLEDSAAFDGGHFLIRSSTAPGELWHTYQENIRLVSGQLHVLMSGCRQQCNCSPIIYSNAAGLYGATTTVCETWPSDFLTLPSAEYETTPTWGTPLYSAAPTGSTWTVAVAGKDNATVQAAAGYRPKVTFTPDDASAVTRPVFWMAVEDHDPTIAVPGGLPAASDTEGDGNLYDLTLHVNSEWRGASGQASFYHRDTAQYSTWLPRGEVVLNFGWQADPAPGGDLAAADVATMWIKPGGITRARDGEVELGRPGLAIEYADLIEVKFKDTCIVDMGQAGASQAEPWFQLCAERIGIPTSRVAVAAGIAAAYIPSSKPFPSTEHLAPQDGDSWETHFDDVCAATGWRWGYNPFTGKLFLDAGKPEYSHGVSTISFTVDYNTLTVPSVVFNVAAGGQGESVRNRYKIAWGDEAHRRATYYKAADSEIQATGQDLWVVADDKGGDTVLSMKAALDRAYRQDLATLRFTTFLQRALKPDQFVEIGDLPEVGVTTGTVWQITEITHSRQSENTEVAAVLVYTPS